MAIADFSVWHWLAVAQHELLLFAGIFFLIGALDDFAVDLYWIWLRLTGRARTKRIDSALMSRQQLSGQAAIFIPAWQEEQVIGDTIAHALRAWPQSDLRLYVGCYRNDWGTIRAAMAGAPNDPRLRLVLHDRAGPTTKADCLNRLYRALCEDEERTGKKAHMVVFHDAEDMVDPAALPLLDHAIGAAEFVQLPVLSLPQERSRWLGSHYCEEFAEAHGKTMVVRNALGAAVPAAGVGCAISRGALEQLAEQSEDCSPFAADSITEDYEMGLSVAANGGRSRFLRMRHADGSLIATRAYFPTRLDQIVRQKTRWIHGIALQGWDRTGWTGSLAEIWMRVRDRRGPIAALVLLTAYLLLAISTVSWGASLLGQGIELKASFELKLLLALNLFAFVWRASWRFGFTAREFGAAEGFRAVLRVPVTNIIAIMAGRRALFAYARTLTGHELTWDKTPHFAHPTRPQGEAIVL